MIVKSKFMEVAYSRTSNRISEDRNARLVQAGATEKAGKVKRHRSIFNPQPKPSLTRRVAPTIDRPRFSPETGCNSILQPRVPHRAEVRRRETA